MNEIAAIFLHFNKENLIYSTNKIPFLDVYGDINLVDHVIKSYDKARSLFTL